MTVVDEAEYTPDVPELPEFTERDAVALGADLEHLGLSVAGLATSLATAVEYLYCVGELENLAETLAVVRAERQRLHALEAYVESKTARLGFEQGLLKKGVVLPDGRRVEFRGGAKRSDWRVDDVLRDVTRASLDRIGSSPGADVVEPDSGVCRPLGEVLAEYRADLVAVLPNGTNSIRTTHLKALGLTPGEYCTTEPGRRTVHIQPKADDT